MSAAKEVLALFQKLVKQGVPEPVAKDMAAAIQKNQQAYRVAKGDIGFDSRYDTRKLEQQKLQDFTTTRERNRQGAIPMQSIVDFEGKPYITTMSDRTDAGKTLTEINGVKLNRPVRLLGGQDYMFDNNNAVWASAKSPVSGIMNLAKDLKKTTGQDALLMPWRMAPTGSDFATMTGEVMLAYAQTNMNKAQKAALNKAMKDFIPDWKGIDHPEAIRQFESIPDKKRKPLTQYLDREFRDNGGLSLGQARLAIAAPDQINAPEGFLQNVGQIAVDSKPVYDPSHPSYPYKIQGEGVARLKENVPAYALEPKSRKQLQGKDPERLVEDFMNPTAQDIRSLQMGARGGIITDKHLRALQDKGVIPAVVGGVAVTGATMSEDAEAGTKAYKLFREVDGKLYPLFVNANDEVPMGQWLRAEAGELTDKGQVKSKLGPLAYRPGWHAGDYPVATHIGGKMNPKTGEPDKTLKAPNYRPDNQVWAEVEFKDDVDWQSIADSRASRNKKGEIIPRTAHITDQVPYDGFYRYKTNSNMDGTWLIGGDMKVNRRLSPEEVKQINAAGGKADLPTKEDLLAQLKRGGAGLGMFGGATLLSPEDAQAAGLSGSIEAPTNPNVAKAYDMVSRMNNKIGDEGLGMFIQRTGIEDYLRKVAYGDDVSYLDRLFATLDLSP